MGTVPPEPPTGPTEANDDSLVQASQSAEPTAEPAAAGERASTPKATGLRAAALGLRAGVAQVFSIRGLWMLVFFLGLGYASVSAYARLVVTDLPVVVLDFDHSKLSRTLIRFIEATRDVKVVEATVESPEQAEALMTRGEAVAVVLIPSGFSATLKRGQRASLPVAVDYANILTGRLAYKAIATCVGTVSAGVQLTLVRKLGGRKERALAQVVPLKVEESFPRNPGTNYMVYLGPGLLFFFLELYLLLHGAWLFLPERRPRGFLDGLGRLAVLYTVGLGLGALFLFVLLPTLSVDPESAPSLLFGYLAAFVGLCLLLALAVGALSPSPLSGLQLTAVLGLLAMMISGMTWPTDAFPAPLAALSKLIPFSSFSQVLQVALYREVDAATLKPSAAWMTWQALILSGLAASGFGLRWAIGRLKAPKEVAA